MSLAVKSPQRDMIALKEFWGVIGNEPRSCLKKSLLAVIVLKEAWG